MDIGLIPMPCKGTDDIGNEEAKHSVEEEQKKDDYDDDDNEFEKEDPVSQLDTCSQRMESTYQLNP
jgi:hypothetical protein